MADDGIGVVPRCDFTLRLKCRSEARHRTVSNLVDLFVVSAAPVISRVWAIKRVALERQSWL